MDVEAHLINYIQSCSSFSSLFSSSHVWSRVFLAISQFIDLKILFLETNSVIYWNNGCIRNTTKHQVLQKEHNFKILRSTQRKAYILKIMQNLTAYIQFQSAENVREVLTFSPLMMWFAELSMQKLLVAQAEEIEQLGPIHPCNWATCKLQSAAPRNLLFSTNLSSFLSLPNPLLVQLNPHQLLQMVHKMDSSFYMKPSMLLPHH